MHVWSKPHYAETIAAMVHRTMLSVDAGRFKKDGQTLDLKQEHNVTLRAYEHALELGASEDAALKTSNAMQRLARHGALIQQSAIRKVQFARDFPADAVDIEQD